MVSCAWEIEVGEDGNCTELKIPESEVVASNMFCFLPAFDLA